MGQFNLKYFTCFSNFSRHHLLTLANNSQLLSLIKASVVTHQSINQPILPSQVTSGASDDETRGESCFVVITGEICHSLVTSLLAVSSLSHAGQLLAAGQPAQPLIASILPHQLDV